MTARFPLFFIIFSIVCVSLFLSLSKGSTSVSLYQLLFTNKDQIYPILLDLRLPRTLTAFTCGALLALSGSLIQLLLQNSLADPYALGVSGGAAFFTLLMLLLGWGESWLLAGAWIGSLLTIFLMLFLARKHRWQTQTLLLAGIAIACGFSAGISCLLIISPEVSLHSMLFWLSGDLNDARYPWVGLVLLIASYGICHLMAPGLNILSRGETEAKALGLSSKRYRITLYLLSSLLTATAVTMAGCIGFIGLVVPHIARQLVGFDHRILLPVSLLLGGSLLTLADTFARSLMAPTQLPVGILTAIIGVPVFIWLLNK